MIDPNTFLEENNGLIMTIVNRFTFDTPKFSRDDLVQEAKLAAVKALERFDPNRNKSKLTTYVYSAVHRTCRDFVRKNKHDLYITNYHQVKHWRENQDTPDNKVGPSTVRLDWDDDEGNSLRNAIPSGDPSAIDSSIKQEQVDILLEELELLPEKERDVLMAQYFEDKKLSEIARDHGVTRQRIHQVSKKAFQKLQKK